MGALKTIEVTSKDHGGQTVLINEVDFDPEKHTLVGEAAKAPAQAKAPEPKPAVAPEPKPAATPAPKKE
jgi:hypothetical protein